MAEHICSEFACVQCQQPATYLHCLPRELNQTIAQKMHKSPPYLKIKLEEEEDGYFYMHYKIKSAGITKYYQRIPSSQFELSAQWKQELIKYINNFREGKDYLRGHSEGAGQDYYVILPGISVGTKYFYKDKKNFIVDYSVQYLSVSNENDNFCNTYSIKYLPAFMEMLDDIEKRLLAAANAEDL